jgi:hypothetical protein
MAFGYFGIRQSIQNRRAARKDIARLKRQAASSGQRTRQGRKAKRAEAKLQQRIQDQKAISRRELFSICIKGAVVAVPAGVGIFYGLKKLLKGSLLKIISPSPPTSFSPSLAPYSDLIRSILFDPTQKDLSKLVAVLQKKHSPEEISSLIQQLRSRVENQFKNESRQFADNQEKTTINIWGRTIILRSSLGIDLPNQILRKIGSDKRLFFGVSASGAGLLKSLIYGKIRKEELVKTKGGEKLLLVFKKGGAIVKKRISGSFAMSDHINNTALFEDSFWDSIEIIYQLQSQGSHGVRLLARALFREYGITSHAQLKLKEKELLEDVAEFHLAHERDHYEIIARVGTAHKSLKTILPPRGVVIKDLPISYFFTLDEFIADLAGLQHLLSIAKKNPSRARKVMLFCALVAVVSIEKDIMPGALYRSMVFALLQNAMTVKPDGTVKFNYKTLARGAARARRFAEKDLKKEIRFIKSALIKFFGRARYQILKRVTRADLNREGVPLEHLDQMVTQRMYFDLTNNRSFLLMNAVHQTKALEVFERSLMQRKDIVGSAAGKFKSAIQFCKARLKQLGR